MIERPYWGDPKEKQNIDLSKNVHYDKQLHHKIEKILSNHNFNICDYPNDYLLYDTLSKYYKIPINQLSIGFGATEIIERVLRALPLKKLYILAPIFEMVPVYCSNNNINYEIISSIDNIHDPHASVYIVNPNGNDGSILDLSQIHDKFQYCIIDEVYSEFNDSQSLLSLNYPNVIIIKSLSKSLGVAGMRVGFCKASIPITLAVQQLRHGYCSASISTFLIPMLINDTRDVINRMIKSKRYLEFTYQCKPSNGNYVLFYNPNILTDEFGFKFVNGVYRMALADMETLKSVIDR